MNDIRITVDQWNEIVETVVDKIKENEYLIEQVARVDEYRTSNNMIKAMEAKGFNYGVEWLLSIIIYPYSKNKDYN